MLNVTYLKTKSMKRFFILGILLCSIAVNAQLLEFGVIGGINIPNLKMNGGSQITDITTENGTGYHIGAMARINLVFIYVQPQVLYTNTEAIYSLSANNTPNNGTYNMQFIDVPVPVALKIGPAGLFAGPVASFAVASPNEIFEDSYKSATWGYQVGASIKFLGFLAEVKFEGPFSNQATTAMIGGQEFDLKARQSMVIMSVGYFFKGKK